MTALIIGLVVVAVVIAVALASQRSGPRITTIETRHERADDEEEGS